MSVWHLRLTRPSPTAIARGTLWASVALNVVLLVGDLARREYQMAVWQSLVIAALTAWMVVAPKIHRRLDARVDEAVNQSRMTSLALQEMERQVRAGAVHIHVGSDELERRH